MRYKNKTTENIDTFSTNTDGKLSGKVGYLIPDEEFDGQDYGSVLKILSGQDAGRWVYESKCAVVPTPPAPEPTPEPPPEPTPSPTEPRRLSVIVDGVKVFEMDIV